MKKTFDIILMAFLIVSMIIIYFSGNRKSAFAMDSKFESATNVTAIPDSLFVSGDLIFRDGRGIISQAFRKFSRTDPRYSHAGIIHKENGTTYVYHIIGGETINSPMKMEEIHDFCSPSQSFSYGVYRSSLDAHQIDSLAGIYYKNKTVFDTRFELSSDDKLYCTELIYKIFQKVSGKNNFLPLTEISGVKYEACDNIFLSPHVKEIYSFAYTN